MKIYIRQAIDNAQKILAEDYGIDFSKYGKGKWTYWTDPATGREDKSIEAGLISGYITWTHKKSKGEVCMTEVYVNVADGSIEQYGSNYGALTL